jgi:hypothetical protein
MPVQAVFAFEAPTAPAVPTGCGKAGGAGGEQKAGGGGEVGEGEGKEGDTDRAGSGGAGGGAAVSSISVVTVTDHLAAARGGEERGERGVPPSPPEVRQRIVIIFSVAKYLHLELNIYTLRPDTFRHSELQCYSFRYTCSCLGHRVAAQRWKRWMTSRQTTTALASLRHS